MITTVTLNPAIDNTILIDTLEYGSVNRIDRGQRHIGGKGINVSKVLGQLGSPTKSIGFLGRFNKDEALSYIEEDGIAHEFLYLNDVTRTNTIIVDAKRTLTTNINEKGFTVTEADKRRILSLIDEYANRSDYVVFSGSIPNGFDKDIYQRLIDQVENRSKTVLDADGELLLNGLKGSPYLVKPNIHELENAYHLEIHTDSEVVDIARRIISEHQVVIVLVSMGGDGSILVTKDIAYKADPIPITVRNTVGAGDSMVAGFLHGLSKKASLKECFVYGNACGTIAAMSEANQTMSLPQVKELAEKLIVHEL